MKIYPLPDDVETMCAYCPRKATHFGVVNYSYGKLYPLCTKELDMMGEKIE